MRGRRRIVWLALAMAIAAGSAASSRDTNWQWRLPADVSPPPVPADNPMNKAKVALGRRLFYDADLSVNGTLACATCHEQRRSFSDGVSAHPGVHGDPGLRNAPSLLNVAWINPLTWANPMLTTLEIQVAVPITGEDPVEMGMKDQLSQIAVRLGANPCYRKLFRAAFPEEKGRIDLATVSKALAAFQRTIVSYESPWDKARAAGQPLPDEARRGEALFATLGCASCHSGANFSDGRFHPFASQDRDSGLARATGRAADAGLFRTPSLRNVVLTAPYLHDGSAPTIDAAIARHGQSMTPVEGRAIAAFLDQLTDRSVVTDPALSLPPAKCTTDS